MGWTRKCYPVSFGCFKSGRLAAPNSPAGEKGRNVRDRGNIMACRGVKGSEIFVQRVAMNERSERRTFTTLLNRSKAFVLYEKSNA